MTEDRVYREDLGILEIHTLDCFKALGEKTLLGFVLWGAVLVARELTDLRVKDKALEPYIQHKEDCPFIEDMTDGDKMLAKGSPQCTCGLVELRAKFVRPVMVTIGNPDTTRSLLAKAVVKATDGLRRR